MLTPRTRSPTSTAERGLEGLIFAHRKDGPGGRFRKTIAESFETALASDSVHDPKIVRLERLFASTIRQAFEHLLSQAYFIQQHLADTSKPLDMSGEVDAYYSLIPHFYGPLAPPAIKTMESFEEEVRILKRLGDRLPCPIDLREQFHENSCHLRMLKLKELTALVPKDQEHEALCALLRADPRMQGEVISIFRIARPGEEERFSASRFATLEYSDRRLLWHGSRRRNFMTILTGGPRTPEPTAYGGDKSSTHGVYFADTAAISIPYCRAETGQEILLLLCEVELGPSKQRVHTLDYPLRPGDTVSSFTVFNTAREPGKWKHAGMIREGLRDVSVVSYPLPCLPFYSILANIFRRNTLRRGGTVRMTSVCMSISVMIQH